MCTHTCSPIHFIPVLLFEKKKFLWLATRTSPCPWHSSFQRRPYSLKHYTCFLLIFIFTLNKKTTKPKKLLQPVFFLSFFFLSLYIMYLNIYKSSMRVHKHMYIDKQIWKGIFLLFTHSRDLEKKFKTAPNVNSFISSGWSLDEHHYHHVSPRMMIIKKAVHFVHLHYWLGHIFFFQTHTKYILCVHIGLILIVIRNFYSSLFSSEIFFLRRDDHVEQQQPVLPTSHHQYFIVSWFYFVPWYFASFSLPDCSSFFPCEDLW